MSDSENESEENSSNSSNTSSESSEDDDNDSVLDDMNEKDFLKTLSCLKNKDPQIYDKNVQFFCTDETKLKKKSGTDNKNREKSMFIRDYEREILVKGVVSDAEVEEKLEKPITYIEEQKAIKESFKNLVNSDSSDDEECSNLLKKKSKGEDEKLKEEEDYIQWLKGKKDELDDKQVETELKPLYHFWNNPSLDKKEEFLKDYILNKRYLEKDEEGNYDMSELSEDEKLLEEQEDFEHKYNFRFEGNDNKNIKRYPRNIEGSLRRKNDTRKKKREEIQKRKKEEKEKKKMEIKKKQKEKLKQVEENLKKIKEITGNEQLGFRDEEILEDFDPEKYDRKMSELYDEDFYSKEISDKPNFSNALDDEDGWNVEDINMDCEAEMCGSSSEQKESRSKRKRKRKKSKAYTDICDIVKPTYDPEKHSTYQKYIDQYYNLDCEDFVDDIPCRFKYREVVPNDYGLTVEEILIADDKELNRWVSAKKMCKIRPKQVEKNEVKIYKQKGMDSQLKMKLLPSLFKEDEDGEEIEATENMNQKKNKKTKHKQDNAFNNKIEETKAELVENNKISSIKLDNSTTEGINSCPSIKRKKNKLNNQNKNNCTKDVINGISDSRLLAYNIKPKQFRSKLKHSKPKK